MITENDDVSDDPRPRARDPLAVRRVVVGVLSWLLFALAWWVVLRRHGSRLPDAVLVLPASAALGLVLTSAWVRHNRRIYRRKGPRRAVREAAAVPVADRLGRPLDLHGPVDVLSASEVVVDVVDGRKCYRVSA